MDNAIGIRSSRDEDLPAITRIYRHYVAHSSATFELDPPVEDEMARRRAEILGRRLPYLVAEIEGTVAGYAYATLYRPRPAYRFTVEDSIYIDPDFTGKGGGRMLLGALIEGCERGPWRQMVAVIGDRGNVASVRLHQSLGFRHV